MPKIKTKQDALNVLQNLDERVLVRMAELSYNKKALSYFQNTIQFNVVKSFLSS